MIFVVALTTLIQVLNMNQKHRFSLDYPTYKGLQGSCAVMDDHFKCTIIETGAPKTLSVLTKYIH